jgi:hypothetical protein
MRRPTLIITLCLRFDNGDVLEIVVEIPWKPRPRMTREAM